MADEQLQAGDVVQLKSGGPKMVIEWINRKNPPNVFANLGACCSWFDSSGKQHTKMFAESALKKVPSD